MPEIAARPSLSVVSDTDQPTLHDTTEPNPAALLDWECRAGLSYWLAMSKKKQKLTPTRRPALRLVMRELGLECFLYAVDVLCDPMSWWVKNDRLTIDSLLDIDKCDTWAVRHRDYNNGVAHPWPDRYATTDPKPE